MSSKVTRMKSYFTEIIDSHSNHRVGLDKIGSEFVKIIKQNHSSGQNKAPQGPARGNKFFQSSSVSRANLKSEKFLVIPRDERVIMESYSPSIEKKAVEPKKEIPFPLEEERSKAKEKTEISKVIDMDDTVKTIMLKEIDPASEEKITPKKLI